MLRKSIRGLLAAILMVSLCSCSNAAPGNSKYSAKVLRINSGIFIASCIQQVIEINHLLEKYLPDDVSVEWTSIASSPDIRDAMVANQIDIASFGAISFITAYESGVPLVILSSTMPAPVGIYTTRSHINTFSDIGANDRIGLTGKASAAELSFMLRCKEIFGNALIFSDNIVTVPADDMVAMIQGADDCDLYCAGFPVTQRMSYVDNAKLVYDFAETSKKYGNASYLTTTEDFYKNNPGLIEAFRKATEDAVKYLNENTDEAAKQLFEFYGVTQEEVVETLKKCQPNLKVTGYDDIAGLLYEIGILTEPATKFSNLPYYSEIPK